MHDERAIRTATTRSRRTVALPYSRGNLVPDGAVIKDVAASAHLLAHSGPAVVFEDYSDMQRRVNDS